jgi:hypothetical protein
VLTPSSLARERKRKGERERKRKGEREKEEGREEKERVFFKGMTGALAPFIYLVVCRKYKVFRELYNILQL